MDFQRRAFTLLELLIILAIICLLAMLLFPAFARAREMGKRAACGSNLKQLGLAVQQYSADYDDRPPYAVDPSDKALPDNWDSKPDFQALIPDLPNIMEVLAPYIQSSEVWRCPSDSGFDLQDSTSRPLNGRPTSFGAFGTSYFYRTSLALEGKQWAAMKDDARVDVLFDAWGGWHGRDEPPEERRYNVLFGDGHVKNSLRLDLETLDNEPL